MAIMHRRASRRRCRAVTWLAVPLGAVVFAAGGYVVVALVIGGLPTSVPSCSWPLRVRGGADSEQARLVRCYLKALAQHDASGLLAVADTTSGQVTITGTAFRHSADAQSGTAIATFVPSQMDYNYAVRIVFADHARDTVAMGLANPGSLHSWRLGIGTRAQPGGGPPPAEPGQ